jgi:protein associated with RNAse G/E
MQVGELIRVEARKHDGSIHRIWKKSMVLKTGEPLIIANFNAEVIEKDGNEKVFPGLCICVFSQMEWYHTVMIFHPPDLTPTYYCNIASPYRLDLAKNTLTYTDYDLDVIVTSDLKVTVVDEEEFLANIQRFHYPPSLVDRVREATHQLVNKVKRKEEPFTPSFAQKWYHQYFSLSKN